MFTVMNRLDLVLASMVIFAAGCGLSIDLEVSNSATELESAAVTTSEARPTTSVEPATTLPSLVTSTTTAAPVTTTTEVELLPIPEPITSPPPDAGEWGEIVVRIESFWDENFSDFAGAGIYEPLDRDRIVAVDVDDQGLPSCDAADVSARTVQDNAFSVTCREGQLIVWDDDDLFAELVAEYGDIGPAIVLAHELGHAAQFQARVLRRTASVIIEQQADCLAGAFASWAADRGVAPFDTPESLDAAVGATVSFRDEPGSSSNSPNAHGSGFDRVRAFQDGFDQGVSLCASYPDSPPPITEIGFSAEDFATGGNMDFALLIESLTPYFNDFFSVHLDGWIEMNPTPDDLSDWRRDHFRVGDNATGTRLALLFAATAQESLGIESESQEAILQQACVAGGLFEPLFFVRDNSPDQLSLSAGDLDEAVITLTHIVEDSPGLPPGFLFDMVAALRVGFIEGFDACELP